MPKYLYSFTNCISSPPMAMLEQVMLLLNFFVPKRTLFVLPMFICNLCWLHHRSRVFRSVYELCFAVSTTVDDV